MGQTSADSVVLLQAAYIVPVRPAGRVLENHAVAVSNDTIADIGPLERLQQAFPGADSLRLPSHALIPGLINMHTHSPMTLLRGYADDMALQTWLSEHIWPAEQRFADKEFITDGTRLAVAEMLRGGTTCFNDMYFHPRAIAGVCLESGIRAQIGVPLIENAALGASTVDTYLKEGEQLHHEWRSEPLLRFSLAPHAPYTVSDDTLRRVRRLSAETNMPVHMHVLETAWEARESLRQHGIGPLARLDKLELLNNRLQAVHVTQVSDDEIELLKEKSVHVVHCPQSNLKLASGFCPVADLANAGVNVSVGTDGAASNNDLDMLSEVQTASLLAKGAAGDAEAVNAFEALEMMTINAALALGTADQLGSIEPGKFADLCAVDLNQPETQPLHNVVSQLIYAASSRQVTDVWVAGKRLLNSGKLTTIDLEETIGRAQIWKRRLADFKRERAGRERVR